MMAWYGYVIMVDLSNEGFGFTMVYPHVSMFFPIFSEGFSFRVDDPETPWRLAQRHDWTSVCRDLQLTHDLQLTLQDLGVALGVLHYVSMLLSMFFVFVA